MKEILIGIAILIVIVMGIVSWDKSQVRVSCQNFGTISNRETKYVQYTYLNYDCITPDNTGKWISVTMLRSTD